MIVTGNRRSTALVLVGLLTLVAPTVQSAEERPRWLAIVASGLVEAVQPLVVRRRGEGCEVQLHTVSRTDNLESQLAWVKSRVRHSSTPVPSHRRLKFSAQDASDAVFSRPLRISSRNAQ